MSQTTAPLRTMEPGRLGLNAEPFNPTDIVSKIDSDGKLYFGRAVTHDTAAGEDQVKHNDAAAQVVAGVVLSSHALVSQSDSDDPNYAAKQTAPIMKKGKVWVAINEDVAVGDDVYVVHTGAGDLGKFRTDATNADQLTNARWAKGGTLAQGFALLELDIL